MSVFGQKRIYLEFIEVQGVNGACVLRVVVKDGRVTLDEFGGIVNHDVATICTTHNHTAAQIGCFHAFAAPYDLVKSETNHPKFYYSLHPSSRHCIKYT